MSTLNTTPNRGYEEPFLGNDLSVDVGRLIAALRAIDIDMANALAAIVAKASLASPAFTGVPTAPTAAPGTDTGQLATTSFVRAAIVALIDTSPAALDTLNELAAALGNDPNFSTTVLTEVGLKADAEATTSALAGKLAVDASNVGDATAQAAFRAAIGAKYTLGSQQIFTASGTWTKPAGCRAVRVRVVGPGGGGASATGGSSTCSVGAGGGSGEYAEKWIASGLGATETVTIGTGGAGGAVAVSPANPGSNGSGPSSFGAHVSAGAGSGGGNIAAGSAAATVTGGAGGSGGAGSDFTVRGQPGGCSLRLSGTIGISGAGGSGPWGGGGAPVNQLTTGLAGVMGAGGSGAASFDTAQRAGGAGGDGIVIVEEYY